MKRVFGLVLCCAALSACAATAEPPAMGRAPSPPAAQPADAAAAERIKPFQYLYGSAEAGAVSVAAFHALLDFARGRVAERPADSVVLADGSTLDRARFVPCGGKPLAAVFDADETAILNLGFEARAAATGEPFSSERWKRWEKTGSDAVEPVPGAVTAVNALRKMGVTVIFNSNRDASEAGGTAATIAAAGLGKAVHGETLFLEGDDAMGSGKDGRRRAISAKYCVIAMAGDQLGDFSDLFNAKGLTPASRRRAALHGWAATMWGNGWFVLPNPVYGPQLKGGIDDIFPADKRWNDETKDTR